MKKFLENPPAFAILAGVGIGLTVTGLVFVSRAEHPTVTISKADYQALVKEKNDLAVKEAELRGFAKAMRESATWPSEGAK